jgi:hypothetical protein
VEEAIITAPTILLMMLKITIISTKLQHDCRTCPHRHRRTVFYGTLKLTEFLIARHVSLFGYLLMLSELGPYRLNMVGHEMQPEVCNERRSRAMRSLHNVA